MENETVSKNFIEQEIDKDLAEKEFTIMYAPVSRRSRMDTFILVMRSLSF